LAVIPSVHKTENTRSCAIQLITDSGAYRIPFPDCDCKKDGKEIVIADNRFGRTGIQLNIQTPECHANGILRFGSLTPIHYDIMGPFRYVPVLQCRHSVYSMRHTVDGEITINDTRYLFHNAVGYIEGDRGFSFPKEYLWTQCSFPEGALMLSVADIPLGIVRFTGVIGIVLLNGKEYRLATYLGGKAVKLSREAIIIRQKGFELTVIPREISGHSLWAPLGGAMNRTINEHPSCSMYYRFTKDGVPLLELDAEKAAFEYEY